MGSSELPRDAMAALKAVRVQHLRNTSFMRLITKIHRVCSVFMPSTHTKAQGARHNDAHA
jgi:hypothetical protein